MEDNAAEAENNEDPPPQQPPPPVQRSRFDVELERLGRNEYNWFDLDYFRTIGRDEKLSIPQARALSGALMRSTSVEHFALDLSKCSLPAIHLLLDYIRTSSYLKEISAEYNPRPSDSEEMQQRYKIQMDRLCQAVQDNDSIHKLTFSTSRGFLINSSPNAIYNLLSKKRSLTDFTISDCRLEREMALAVAAGLSKSSVYNVHLDVAGGPLDIIIAGLVAGPVKSLYISHENPYAALWEAVSRLMLFSSSLEDLEILLCDDGVTRIFSDLCHPSCTSLHSLHLENVALAAHTEENSSDGGVSIEQHQEANATVHTLRLVDVTFETPRAVRLLWNVVGIRDLYIDCPIGDVNEHIDPDDCAEFIRRNTNLTTVKLMIYDEHSTFLGRALLEGARSLTALTALSIEGGYDRDTPLTEAFGVRLCSVLEHAPSLSELSFERIHLGQECITLLALGLVSTHALQVLHFTSCSMVACGVTEIVEGLLENETLHVLTFTGLEVSGRLGLSFCHAVSRMFRINKSLTKLRVSKVDLREGALSEMLLGLRGNNVMKSLIFSECPLDNAAMTALGQALESPTSVLSEIGLPRNTPTFPLDNNVEEGVRTFLTGLVRMPSIQKVYFGSTIPELDKESRGLLLQAVKQNKNICVLIDYCNSTSAAGSEDDDDDDPSAAMELSEIEYYLKLNRFGRRLLDSTNLLTSLWPKILSRMTSQPNDVDALFFFLREYFSRQGATQDEDDNNDDDSYYV